MADILISVGAKIAEFTVEPVGRQVGYLLCYKNNLKELKDQVEELQTTKERIDHEVEAEERNLREIQGDVIRWRQGVIKSLEQVEKLCEDEPHASVQCWKWSFPNLKSRHQLGRKAKKMTKTIVEMTNNGNSIEGVGYAQHLNMTNNVFATRGIEELQSRNSVKENVVLSLKDPKVSRIGIYGIGGVGKTTLVKQVAKQVKDDKLFDTVIMATVSLTNLERIQDEIAEQLGFYDLKGITSSIGRASCLCERIKKEKTILIILDDLREKIDLDKLGIPSLDTWGKMNPEKVGVPLKDDYKGCKLLMTSRSQDILQINDDQKNFPLQVLNDEESWSLFEAMVGDVVKDDNFKKIATQVDQRCVGLPVLIVTIAKSLKYNQDIYYWKDTLNNLQRVDKSRDMNETLFSALEFNFNRLEDEVKKVFLLCGVHGTSILVSDLLKYAIGLGIFKCINTIEDARNRLYRIIIDLKAYCLLVDDDARSVVIKMHDIVHEVAVSMASKYAFTRSNAKLQDWPRKDILERCTHIILHCCCIQKLPERLDCPYLTFLLIDSTDNRTLEIPDSFFERVGNLEALDLTGMIMSSLPISLSSLTKLKTLCLDQCSLKDMTGIGALMNLEILSLIHSSVEEFPREIKQLSKLRMLDLSRSGIGTTLPNILCKLTKIEELYMGDAIINWVVESSARQKRNASLAKLGDLTCLTTLEIQIREAWLLPKDIAFEKLERYKVVIGDEWEWSDNKETSRLLKVKLDTNIRSEWGIKTLIERVEDLYLDETSGISNVLFEMNGEGFPLLRNLHIQNNGEIQHIVNSMKRNQTHVLFPELQTMILHNLNNLVKICHGSVRDNSFGKLKIVKVKSCDQLEYLISVSMVKAFSQLVEIEVSECGSMKNIMSVESTDTGKTIDEKIEFLPLRTLTLQRLPTIDYFCSQELTSSRGTMENLLRDNISTPFFSAKVKFSNLETLKLSSVNLKKIWDDSSAPYLVHNLANLTVEDCSGLKYLFSSSIVGRLSNLRQLEISKCDMMEEIIATEEINGVAVGEVLFPKLESIIIKDMQNLKSIWHLILASNSLACLKTLKVKNCEKIERIFPEYMNGAFAALETLKVEDYTSVQEIFQFGDNADDEAQLKYITLLRLPKLKQIWSKDSQSSLRFKSLKVVCVKDCGDLEYLFPFFIAKHLPQLEAVTITNAEKMKEIVSKREEPLDNPVKFEFHQLTSMVLCSLHDLQGFCAGNHSLSCSSLKKLDVYHCKKLKLFKTQGANGQGRLSDDNLHFSIQQPLFTLEEVIENLESLSLSNEDARMIFQSQVPRDQFRKLKYLRLLEFDAQATSPSWFLQNISNLERLVIQEMSLRVIFPDERPQHENGEIEIKTRLKMLTLLRLYELQHICKEECQLDPVLEVLEYLNVDQCSSLKHLVPSSVAFNHLAYLEVGNCSGLIYLITSSTARSLVNLMTLKIIKCDSVEQIVAEAGGESICEIVFKSLQVLELESLPKLKMFCSSSICCLKLPMLEKLVIRQCARMERFSASDASTPLLREILTDEQDKKWFCEGDLNKTVNKMFQDKVAFRSAKSLELSEYPELKELWSSHEQMGIFSNLTNLVVHKCDFLSDVLLPLNLLQALSNLEELKVSECDSLRAVFDLTNMNERGMSAKVIFHLKTIELSRLPELKHIWKTNCQEEEEEDDDDEGDIQHEQPATFRELGVKDMCNGDDTAQLRLPKLKQIRSRDSQSSLRFKSLQVVCVKDCGDLEYLFPFFIAKHLPQLEAVTITNAEKMKEIVSKREEPLDNPVKFEFHLLTSMVLCSLHDLQGFCAGNHSLSCSSLKKLNVCHCKKLKLFKTQGANGQGRLSDDNLHFSIQQPLFTLEEVIENLESLSLSNEDARMIFQSQVPRDQFRKLKYLRLLEFDAQATYPYWFLQNMSNLENLCIQDMSLRLIFPDGRSQHENGEIEIKTRLKMLTLFRLYELQHICKEECQLDPVLEVLEYLNVDQCSSLKHLVPSSVAFNHLAYLEVGNCSGLIYLITSSTARSLVNLMTLKIIKCDSVEQIVAEAGVESICEIVFKSLQVLELESLPKLKMFCSSSICCLKLPMLEKLVIRQCARMERFSASDASTPLLREILTEEQDKKWFCEGVLNKTVNKIFQDKVAFRSAKHLELSEYPELKELWSSHEQMGILSNLTNLVVHKCDFLSDVLLPLNLLQALSNLEELKVSECDSLRAVFDLTNTNERGMSAKVIFHLKTIELSRLPELKHIWKTNCQEEEEEDDDDEGDIQHEQPATFRELGVKDMCNGDDTAQLRLPKLKQIRSRDSQSSLRFKSLQVVCVKDCGDLEYLFPFFIAKHLPQLEAVTITNAEKMKEIVSKREEPLDNPVKFEFHLLTSMVLCSLHDLQGFCAGNHSLSCSSLKKLDVYHCKKLKLFKTQGANGQGRLSDDNLHFSIQQPLFTLEEVIENLECVTLNNEEASMIFHSQVSRDQFRKLKFLRLVELYAQATYPYWFLQNMSNLEDLCIQDMSLRVIFPDERSQHENGQIEIKTRLKMLTLFRLYELQHICKEECQLDPVLEVLEYLNVVQCSSLKHLVPSSVAFNHLAYLEVGNCSGLIYLITSSTARSLVNLMTLKIIKCDSVEQIVAEAGGESICEIAFKSLQVLELESLPKLKMFCSSSICCLKLPMLEKLVIRQCARMESFSASDASTPFLREILTDEQDKKWFFEGDLNKTVNKMFQDKVAFRSAKHLELSEYPELKELWSSHEQMGILSNLTNLVVHKCDFLSDVLLPLNLLQALSNLEELKVSECDSLRAVFDLTNTNERGMSAKVIFHLKTIELSRLPELKHIWKTNCQEEEEEDDDDEGDIQHEQPATFRELGVKDMCNGDDTAQLRLPKLKQIRSRDSQSSLRFKSLQVVCVKDCGDLEYLFPFFIAKHLPQLEAVTITNAEKMKEIVSKREEPLDNPVKFEFHLLTSMVLCSLHDLQGFCAGNHSLSCSSLKKLNVCHCKKLKLFKTQGANGQGRLSDDNLHFSIQQPLFTLEEVIENLESLSLSNEDARMIFQSQVPRDQFRKLKYLRLLEFDAQATYPYWFLQNMSNLENLCIQDMSLRVIFPDERSQHENGEIEIKTRLKMLTLFRLYELQHICKEECQLDPVLEVLEYLNVDQCSSLKHLVPSSVAFNHLAYLEVGNCSGLIYLITSSTARSLVNLMTLKIRECDSVQEIVAEKGGGSINEIAFNSLEVLELESLSKLQMFCSSNCLLELPLLEKLVIRRCPRMTSFSTRETSAPMLQKIVTDEKDGIWCWEGDLSRTIKKMFQDMVAFSSFNHLAFSEYPELKELWYGQVGQKIFCNLKHLVVRKCTFLSNVIFSSNLLQLLYTLEELEVAECDSLEAVFDVKALDDKEMESKEVSGLKKLILSGLPNLKRIWNREAGKIISFRNLQIVKVDKCQHLKFLFWVSLCQDLRQLEKLRIESCGVEEIVSIEEGLEELKFDFPQLTSLQLFNLTQLTNFYPERYTLACPSLKILNVHGCEELQIFAFDHLNSQPLREGDIELPTKQALFYIEEVCQNLEELPLNEKDSMRILNGNYEKNLFQSIEMLRLQHFQETPIKFINDYIQIFPAMTILKACCSSFETLFPSEEIVHCNIESPAQIKTLWLFQLEQLKHIWSDDDSASYPLVQNLEKLIIKECSGIIRLAPPSASFKNLTSLKVEDCKVLMYFMKSCTAKSLVHLTCLRVCNCEMLEEVVMTDEGESEEEVTFESLKHLKLTCLSGFKSFCSGKHTFIFPTLVKLEVIGCHKMQNFSSGVIIAPFLKSVELENGKKRWKEDLNTTITQLFIDKANGEGVEGDCKESSSINMDNNQTHQKSVITSRALNSDELKAHEIVDSGKQEMHKLPTPHTGIGTQKIYEITETFDQASQSTLKFTKVDAVTETQEMHETTEGDFVQDPQNKFSFTIVQDAECTPDGSQDMQLHLSEGLLIQATKSIKDDDEDNTGTKVMHETTQRLLVQAEDMLIPASVQDIAIESHVTHESIDKPFVQATQNTWDITIVQKKEESHDSDIHLSKNLFNQIITSIAPNPDFEGTVGTREMYEFKGRFLVHDAQNVSSSSMLYETEANEATEKPLIQTTQEAHSSATIQDIADGTQEIHATIQTDQDKESLATTRNREESYDSSIGTQQMCDTIKKPSILVAQNVSISSIMIPKAATIYQSLSQAPELATAQNTESYDSYIETQEKWDTVKKSSSSTAQNVQNSTMIPDAAIDQSPSKAPEPMTSSILESSAYSDNWLIDISKQNLPYLEAGLKRHPQVLDWFNTKRRRAFAALFTEVTCILRTTRRCDLTEDDRNCIRECCTALEAVDFDASWLSYVYGCIESCGDGNELMRKLEETEAKASTLRNELASVEASLVSLRDEASRLRNFIEE